VCPDDVLSCGKGRGIARGFGLHVRNTRDGDGQGQGRLSREISYRDDRTAQRCLPRPRRFRSPRRTGQAWRTFPRAKPPRAPTEEAVSKRSLRRSPSSAASRSSNLAASLNSPRTRCAMPRTLRPPRSRDRLGHARWRGLPARTRGLLSSYRRPGNKTPCKRRSAQAGAHRRATKWQGRLGSVCRRLWPAPKLSLPLAMRSAERNLSEASSSITTSSATIWV